MKRIICLLVFFAAIGSHAQYFHSAQSFGAGLNDYALDVVTDDENNVYFVGGFSETVDFDPGPGSLELTSPSSFDMFVSKQDAEGNLIWTKSFGGDAHYLLRKVELYNNEFLYVTGQYKADLSIETLSGTTVLEAEGEFDLFLAKLTLDGDVVWATGMGGPGPEFIQALAVDTLGNPYCTGYFQETVDFDPGPGSAISTAVGMVDIFIVKFDSDGEFQWHQTHGSPENDEGYGITIDQDNNVAICGRLSGDHDFNPAEDGGEVTVVEDVSFILKLDSDGNYVWVKSIVGTEPNFAEGIASDSEGNFIIVGGYFGVADLDPGPGEELSESYGNADVYVLKLNTDGDLIWNKHFGGVTAEQLQVVEVDESDNIYTGGYYSATVDFDPGPEGEDFYTGAGYQDICVSKFDSDGNYLWARVAGSYSEDRVYGLTIDSENQVSVVGVFSVTVDFNPYDGEANLSSAAYLDAFLWRLTPDCAPTSYSYATTACDSLVSPSGDYVWMTSGTYMDTIQNFSGCDSVLTVELTVNSSFENEETVSLCANYTWPVNGVTYTESGIYTASFTSESGCDSSYTLNLELTTNTNITITDFTLTSEEDEGTYQWVTCPDFEIIDGATNQEFSPLENGEYAVIITKGECVDTTSCVAITGLNLVEDDLNALVSVYPNPTNGKLFIDLGQEYESTTIILTDILGQEIMKERFERKQLIELLTQVPPGTYLLLIEPDDKSSIVRKIVVRE